MLKLSDPAINSEQDATKATTVHDLVSHQRGIMWVFGYVFKAGLSDQHLVFQLD